MCTNHFGLLRTYGELWNDLRINDVIEGCGLEWIQMQKLIKLMRNSKLDASGTMNRETINSLTSFKDAAFFSLLMVSPVVPP